MPAPEVGRFFLLRSGGLRSGQRESRDLSESPSARHIASWWPLQLTIDRTSCVCTSILLSQFRAGLYDGHKSPNLRRIAPWIKSKTMYVVPNAGCQVVSRNACGLEEHGWLWLWTASKKSFEVRRATSSGSSSVCARSRFNALCWSGPSDLIVRNRQCQICMVPSTSSR